MAASRRLASYLTGHGTAPADTPPATTRHGGAAVVWLRCESGRQMAAVARLRQKLTEDGDPLSLVVTLADWDDAWSAHAQPEPVGRDAIRAFIARIKPALGVWAGPALNLALLEEWRLARLPSIWVEAGAGALPRRSRRWWEATRKSALAQFEDVLALDKSAADAIIRAGATREAVTVSGALEDCEPPLPCDEKTRQLVTTAIGARPVWLAASVDDKDWADLVDAHKLASRRAHRLLLVVIPRDRQEAGTYGERLRDSGLHTVCRSEYAAPPDLAQIFIDDTDMDFGLWYRIAPITYLGGTVHGSGCRDPFEPATLGSAVIAGQNTAPFTWHADKLAKAGALATLRRGADLGGCVETLLATDRAASLAQAAWHVTSDGAEVTNAVAGLIKRKIERLGY